MRPADEFVTLYNRLHARLAHLVKADHNESFYQLIDMASKRFPIIRHNEVRLKKYAQLRNAIVHGTAYPAEIIADPTPETLERFRSIVESVHTPRFLKVFEKPVRVFTPEDSLEAALRAFDDGGYSQLVIRERQRLRLLTVEGVARWAAHALSGGIIKTKGATIADALAHEPYPNAAILSPNDTLEEAEAAFERAIARGKARIYAIILTPNGQPQADPSGIVTPWDLIEPPG